MTCSSVHISSWIGLWLLNFCHPPETICSGLHCWKERTMGKKKTFYPNFQALLPGRWWCWAYGLFDKNWQEALSKCLPMCPASSWRHTEAAFHGTQCVIKEPLWYLRHCFICLKTVDRTWNPLPWRGLHSRDQTSQLSFPQICMLPPPTYTKGEKN